MVNSIKSNLYLSIFVLLLAGGSAEALAQDRVYDQGTVWDISYVKTEPGQFDNYMEDLSQVWKKMLDMAVEKGYVVSYKILSGERANPQDWNLMLLVEYENMAALDNGRERFEPIVAEIMGSFDRSNEATAERRQLREILGGKLARELVFVD